MKNQKVKNIVLSCLIYCGLASVTFGGDEFFFWQFNPDSVIEGLTGTALGNGAAKGLVGYSNVNNPYNVMGHVQLYYDSGYGYLTQGDGTVIDPGGIAGSLSEQVPYYAKLESDPSYYYFVELVNESGGLMGYYSLGNYDALSAYIASAGQFVLPELAWSKTDYKAIPEPTSGLLLLLGVAGLALRRKVRKA